MSHIRMRDTSSYYDAGLRLHVLHFQLQYPQNENLLFCFQQVVQFVIVCGTKTRPKLYVCKELLRSNKSLINKKKHIDGGIVGH